MGGNGLALSMKIALNLNIGSPRLLRGHPAAEKSGIDRKVAVEVFTNSALASLMLQHKAGPSC